MAPAQAAPNRADIAALRLLKTSCFSCHNDEKKKGGLVMTSREALFKGGESGAVLVAGAPEESPLITALSADADPHMPPKKQLSAAQIEVLSRWVREGAKWETAALIDQPSAPRQVALAVLPPSYRPILALALSPDSTRLAVGSGNELVIYDVTKTEIPIVARASAHPDPVQAIAWSPDAKQIATGAFRRVVVWDAQSLSPERQITDGLTDRITALRFLPDGSQLVIADGRVAEEGTLRIADIGSGAISASWTAHADTIFDLALSSDGKLLASAGGDKLVKIWDVATHQETARLEGHGAQVLTVGFDPKATQLVTAGEDHRVKVWDVKTRERIITLGSHTAAINAVTWIAAGPAVFVVTDAGGLLRYTELKANSGAQSAEAAKERKYDAADNALYCVAVTANGERVFAGAHDGRVFVWNKEGKVVSKLDGSETKTTAAAMIGK